MKEKTAIQKVVDLLEENGFHVFKAEEVLTHMSEEEFGVGRWAIQLRIAQKKKQK